MVVLLVILGVIAVEIGYLIFFVGCEKGKREIAQLIAGKPIKTEAIPDGAYEIIWQNRSFALLKGQDIPKFVLAEKESQSKRDKWEQVKTISILEGAMKFGQ